MSHDQVLLVMHCELEREALIEHLRNDAPDVDVWYLDATGEFAPANPALAARFASRPEGSLLVFDMTRPLKDDHSAILQQLLMQSELSLLCLLPNNRLRLLYPREFSTSLESIVEIIRRNSHRSRYPLDDLHAYPFHVSTS